MQVKITGKNLNVGASLSSHIEDRLRQIAVKYFDGATRAHVTVEKQRVAFIADCTLNLATGLVLQAHGSAPNAFSSFEATAGHLEKQLRRYKNRLKNHHKFRIQPVLTTDAQSFVIEIAESDQGEEPADLNPVVVAESPASVPELSVGEAVMQLDISNVPFVLFRRTHSGGINLVYRRHDGNIGWLDTSGAQKAAG